MEKKINLRERTRRAVQKEIAETAHALFIENGFEATTIKDIAEKVGMSTRSMFRHFPTKEDLIIGKFDVLTDELIKVLKNRPLDEPVWDSLKKSMRILSQHFDTPHEHGIAVSIEKIIFNTPSLHGTYLQRLQEVQETIILTLIKRAIAAGTPYAENDPSPRALVAAATGCAEAAKHSWLASGAKKPYSELIDKAFGAVRSK